jgi:nucleoside-diphosphate-sugar epimerase
MTIRSALLAGATGLVGRELARQLAAIERYSALHLLLRRRAPELEALPGASALLVNFDDLPAQLPRADYF